MKESQPLVDFPGCGPLSSPSLTWCREAGSSTCRTPERSRSVTSAGRADSSAAAELLGPVPELVFEGEVVAAGHGLEQLGAHGRFGGEAGRAAQDGEGVADAGGDVLLEQRVGVERGGVEPFRS